MSEIIKYLKDTNQFDSMTTNQIVSEIVDDYMGTCESMSTDDFDWLDLNGQLEHVDSLMFNCEICGWWVDIGDQGDTEELICTDCHLDCHQDVEYE